MPKLIQPAPDGDAGTSTCAQHASKPRRSPKKPRLPTRRDLENRPRFRQLYLDGRWAVQVPLYGAYGEGHVMVVDLDTWNHVERRFGHEWTLTPTHFDGAKPVNFSVRTTRAGALANSIKEHWPGGTITLARWIMGATKPEQRVCFRDGDSTNLRRANLVVQRRAGKVLPDSQT